MSVTLGRPPSYTLEEAQQMSELYQTGITLAEVAAQFNTTAMTARKAIRSCGVETKTPLKDYTGMEFNRRRVIGFHHRGKNGVAVWEWECLKCGKRGRSAIVTLKRRNCKRCSHKGEASKHDKYLGCGDINQQFYLRLFRCAKNRGHAWEMTPEFMWDMYLSQDRRCALSGRYIYFDPKYTVTPGCSDVTASLDRKNSDLGYTKENVWWIHKDLNTMKMDMTVEEFVTACREVAAHYQEAA